MDFELSLCQMFRGISIAALRCADWSPVGHKPRRTYRTHRTRNDLFEADCARSNG
nr:hypothetical protein [uncultured bacterium]